ncbi:polysaccharide lyase family 8 super-sandwich domain-containing protein [[Eubacterium] hominis]|uniref:polysaccharide lyase family 8 super-sandwich domain-containing protein n=1 Tax=[Eubacterium] hominis TaxID=2764325 RepID=UPI003A4DAF27
MDRKWRNGVMAVALTCAMTQLVLPYNVLNLQAKESVNSVTSVESFQQIRDYWRSELIGSYQSYATDHVFQEMVASLDEKTKNLSETMKEINEDTKDLWDFGEAFLNQEEGAVVTEAFDRLRLMSIQTMQPTSKYYQNKELKKQIVNAYQFLLDNKYGPSTSGLKTGWWDKEIGTPKAMVDIAILLYDEFSSEQIAAITKTIDRFVPKADYRLGSTLKETGANLCDKVAIVIKRAALDGNNERLKHASSCMDPLFGYVTNGDGFYTDGSFIQHNNIPYNGSYGYVLLDELTNCIIMLSMSEEAVAPENIEFFNQVLIENYLPFISYGGNVVDNVRGRAVSRYAQQGDTMGMQMMGVLLQYADVADDATRDKLLSGLKGIVDEKFAEKQTQDFSMLKYADYSRVKELANTTDVKKLTRNTYQVFSNMDRMVAHREGYTFTIAPSSKRMYNTEQGNQENLLGRYQGQGYYQIYNNDISQYNDHYNATVDSNRISGVTTAHQDITFNTQGQSAWSGGASLDGVIGSAGVIITGDKRLSELANGFGNEIISNIASGIEANKSYFVLNDSIVCIGSDITNRKTDKNVDVLETIVDNRKVQDNKLYVDGTEKQSTNGISSIQNPKYAYLTGNDSKSGMGYVFLEDGTVTLKRETRKQAWSDVNKLAKFTNTEERTSNYVSLAVDHGVDANKDTYKYVILPNASQEETQSYQANEHIEILYAEDGIHAIKDLDSNQTMMNFYKAGSVENVEVNQPVSMVMKSENGMIDFAVSDPTHSLSSVDITLRNVETKKQDIIEGNAKVIESGSDWLTIRVNFSAQDGQSNFVSIGTSYKVESSNLALNKDVEASSVVQNSATQKRLPEFAVDGDADTRWASNYERGNPSITTDEADKGWFLVDLGKEETFNQINLFWENAYSTDYKIYTANTKEALASTSNGVCSIEDGCKEVIGLKRNETDDSRKTDKLTFAEASGRYVKIQSFNRPKLENGTGRGGLSLFEIEITNTLSLCDLLSKAETLIKDYPKESFVNQNEFEQANKALTEAIANAKALMALGNTFEDDALRDVAQQLNTAIRTYDAGVNHVSGIAIDQKDLTIQKNTETTLTYAFTPSNPYNKNVTWKSSNAKIVRVDQTGKIKAIASGTATISVTSEDGNHHDAIVVTVDVKPESITLDQTTISLTRNEKATIKATVLPDDAIDPTLTWTSSNEDIASVDQNGTVVANKVGQVSIKAETVNGLSAECIVNVTANKNVRGKNVALNGKATASSQVNATTNPENAIDGNYDTRWASNYKDISVTEAENQWLLIELPEVAEFNQIDLTWFSETVYGKEYKILVSMDNQTFEEAIHVTNGGNKTYTMKFDTVKAKYVKFQGIKRSATGGGYGIVEFDVYRNYNYDEIVTKAKDILDRYPADLTNQVAAFEALNTAVETADQLLIDNPNFESNELYDILLNVETAYQEYMKYIVPVQDMKVEESLSIKAEKTATIQPIFTPENATNQRVTYTSSDESIVKVDQDGTVYGVCSGTATVTVTSIDQGITKEVVVHVTTNTKPVIHANGTVLLIHSDFDPLANVTATDAEDGEITLTNANIIENTVDTSKEGFYEVVYQVTDLDGNTVEKTIIVQVRQAMNIYQSLSKDNVSIQGYVMEQSILNVTDLKDKVSSYQALLPKHYEILSMMNIELIHDGKEILPNGRVRVSVTLDDWKEITDVLVFQKDGTYRQLEFDKEDGTVIFETDRLSSIAFVKSTTQEDGDNQENPNPKPEEPGQGNQVKPSPKPEDEQKPQKKPDTSVDTSDKHNAFAMVSFVAAGSMLLVAYRKLIQRREIK